MVTAGLGWMLFNTFLVLPWGELRWEGENDPVRLAVLAVAALIGTAAGGVHAAVEARRTAVSVPAPRTAPDAGLGEGRLLAYWSDRE